MYENELKLHERIQLGGDSSFELRLEIGQRDNLADELAAFANRQGGVLLIGVDDDKNIRGLSHIDEAEQLVTEVCKETIDPPLLFDTFRRSINEKEILLIEVPRSTNVHRTRNGYFLRHGSRKKEMSPAELRRLLQERALTGWRYFDGQPVSGTDDQSLDRDLTERFIKQDYEDKDKRIDLLKKRSLLIENMAHHLRASVSAILMCCRTPTDYLPNAFIQAVCYRGKEKDANYQIDAKDFGGPLDQQILDAYHFACRYNQVSARKDAGREDYPQYSKRALFEAIINAAIHRDYSIEGSKIRLFMFADRLELSSPGGLPGTLTIEGLPYRQFTRNQLLAGLLSEISLDHNTTAAVGRKHFLERRGQGIGIILEESSNLSGREPKYELFGDELRLTIYAAQMDSG